MALTREALPFGLRDVKIAPLAADGLPGTLVDLPNSQTFEFSDDEEFTELRGDDRLVAKRGRGTVGSWSLESGGISLEAYKVMAGGALVTSGTAPAEKKTYTKLDTDSRPYFYAEGQAMSDSGGDYHLRVWRCIADEALEGTLGEGEFYVSSASGSALGSLATAHLGKVYERIQNETAAAIVAP